MISKLKSVEMFTDGACSGNPGPGGYGVILKYNGVEKELCGREELTTNNRMELTAVIEGLKILKQPCNVNIQTDSKYVVDAITKGWLENWQKSNWRKADKKPVLNVDLWQQLVELLKVHNVKFLWIKGHNGHTENERCDQLAVKQYLNKKN